MKLKKTMLSLFIFMLFMDSIYSGIGKYKIYKKGDYLGDIEFYELDNRIYFSLDKLAKYLKASKYIYSVSSRIILKIDNKKLTISKNRVSFDDIDSIEIYKPIIIRGSRYFIVSDVFTSSSFAKIFELRIDIDNKNKIISFFDNINVTSIKYFSYIEKTRVVVYMSKDLKYQTDVVGKSLVLSIMNGSYTSNEDIINVSDGNIDKIKVLQTPMVLKISIDMGENFDGYEVFTLQDPHRIVIDVKTKKDNFPSRIDTTTDEQLNSISTISFTLPDKFSANSKKVIVIDPGHGGKDPGGKILFGKKEKQINLEIAKKLYSLLKKNDNFDVYITREGDEFVSIYDRSKFANDKKCDVFISIHANAHKNRNENGFEIYFLSEKATDPWASEVADYENASVVYEDGKFDYSPQALVLHSIARNEYINHGSILASYVSKHLSKNTPFKNRGIKQAAFYVLRGTYCPGILIETGFMTNKRDKKNLDSASIQEKVAKSIYNAIVEYDKKIK